MLNERIVITGVGLTSPIGSDKGTFRQNLLEGKSGLVHHEIRYMGPCVAGFCDYDALKYQKKKSLRRGTRAGSIGIYCAEEALLDAGLDKEGLANSGIGKDRIGVFLGITEHGNVETEGEIYQLHQNNLDTKFWTPHHNPRTVANSPAGEVTLHMGITGPHYTIGAACAGGNLGPISGVQNLLLGEVDVALAGGVSESPQSFGIFAGFAAQGALADDEDPTNAIRPLDITRKGTVISEGGCVFVLERLSDARKRNAKIYGEIVGHAMNSDASDYVNPNPQRQKECMELAIKKAGLTKNDIELISLHATGTGAGDIAEASGVSELYADCSTKPLINFAKGHIGHAMGAAGALEMAGNLFSFEDDKIHPGVNCREKDPACPIDNIVTEALDQKIDVFMNNSFGMMGINSSVIVKRYVE